jgi:hypothetical protein
MVNAKMAELRHWHDRCLTMSMRMPRILRRIGRLFVVKTKWEAWAVTWAVALGGVERGKHYLDLYPGAIGWMFFAACSAVTFLVGAKLLDATRPAAEPVPSPIRTRAPQRRHLGVSRNRPRASRRPAGSASRI